jgi:hypothetical protein
MSSLETGRLPSPRDPFDSSASQLPPITPQPTPPGPIKKVGEIVHKHLGVGHQASAISIDRKASIESSSTAVNPTGPFVALTHGDPCPDNVFDYPDRLLLIDFEWASVGSALLDATYPRMNMPSGWCAGQFPENVLDVAESIYRDAIKQLIPEARDDKIYFEAYAGACAVYILNQSNVHDGS